MHRRVSPLAISPCLTVLPCLAVHRRASPCIAVPRLAVSRRLAVLPSLRLAVCRRVSPCVAVTGCHGMSRYVTVCHGMSRYVTGCHGMSRYVTGCHGMSRDVTGCHGMSRDVTGSLACATPEVRRHASPAPPVDTVQMESKRRPESGRVTATGCDGPPRVASGCTLRLARVAVCRRACIAVRVSPSSWSRGCAGCPCLVVDLSGSLCDATGCHGMLRGCVVALLEGCCKGRVSCGGCETGTSVGGPSARGATGCATNAEN